MIPFDKLPQIVAVVGSRDFEHPLWVSKLVKQIQEHRPTIIVSGGARGVDTVAEDSVDDEWFKPFFVTDQEWKIIGRRAGIVRNEVLIFYLSKVGGCAIIFMQALGSPGALNVIDNCKDYEVPYIVIHADKQIETFGF